MAETKKRVIRFASGKVKKRAAKPSAKPEPKSPAEKADVLYGQIKEKLNNYPKDQQKNGDLILEEFFYGVLDKRTASRTKTEPKPVPKPVQNPSPQPVVKKEKVVGEQSVWVFGQEIKTTGNGSILKLTPKERKDIRKITSLDQVVGLEKLDRLKWLFLDDNDLTDIKGLERFTELTQLTIRRNKIEDITPLTNLTKIRTLDLLNNRIENIMPLVQMCDMRLLQLDGNRIKDISPLKGMKDLGSLYLNHNQIKDISVLANMKKLEYLSLRYNAIYDISPLASLEKLRVLDLSYNEALCNLIPLKNNISLEELWLRGVPGDKAAVEKLPILKKMGW